MVRPGHRLTSWWHPNPEGIDLLAGGCGRGRRVQKTLERGHIDGDGDVGPHPRTGLHRTGIQVGPAQLHQRISTTLGRRPAIISSRNTDDALEHLLDQLSLFVTQPARSEERRVGKECTPRWPPSASKHNTSSAT